jgi:hypothetical protein
VIDTAARMGFEALMAKRRPGDGPSDPWLCFQAGYLFAQVEEARGTVHALAAIKGDLVAGAVS